MLRRFIVSGLLAAALLGGCYPASRPFAPARLDREPGWVAVASVPVMRQQGARDCGAVATAMLLGFWGMPADGRGPLIFGHDGTPRGSKKGGREMFAPARTTHLALALALALGAAGCFASVTARTTATSRTPTFVLIDAGVWVLEDHDQSVFYTDGYYWRYSGGGWYRRSSPALGT